MGREVDAVLMLAFGGPERAEDVRPFLRRVLASRAVPEARIEEVARHYEEIGGYSPLPEITRRQAAALAERLARDGHALPVRVGFRHSEPTVVQALSELRQRGATCVRAVVMAAHEAAASRGRYRVAADAALAEIGGGLELSYASGFHAHPGFVGANAEHIRAAERGIAEPERAGAVVVFTAHSIPSADAAQYVAQLEESAHLIARALDRANFRIGYQSRSGATSGAWLEPAIERVIEEEAARGTRHMLIAPVGFVCDHVEVLYDLDVAAAKLARNHGVVVHRSATVGEHPAFIDALADSVTRG